MAFSGQYAAAQLHHLPLPHSVIDELSDYLGYAPNFAPPSYVKFARVYGRLPLDRCGFCSCREVDDESIDKVCCRVPVHWSDFQHKEFRTDLFDDCWVAGILGYWAHDMHIHRIIKVNPDRLTPALMVPDLHMPVTDDDHEFFRRWSEGPGWSLHRRHAWPYAPSGDADDYSGNTHPAITGAIRTYLRFLARLRENRLRENRAR
jgi:hypothetical protein